MDVNLQVNERFINYIFDWDYEQYLLVGAYGSSKSHETATKIILKLLKEKRKCLVVREVYDTLKESCFDVLYEILDGMNLIYEGTKRSSSTKVIAKHSPMEFIFPNGSRIIFRGMDKPEKVKSINGVSIVWIEEASEVKYEGYKELLGRIRTPGISLHFILTTNPVDTNNWVYQHFFIRTDDRGKRKVILDDEILYKMKTVVKNNVYYHHSIPEDNVFLPKNYIKRLDDMQNYDPDLYRVARHGRFGVSGTKVLPQIVIANSHKEVIDMVRKIPNRLKFCGFDFGFEESYNAIVKVAVDEANKYLYIYFEYYKNHMTDLQTVNELDELYPRLKEMLITADCEDPKAIRFYRDMGYKIRGCKKFAGSRLSNTRKVKRFRKIIISPKCINTIRELENLTYKKDTKGNIIHDEFNIDPHTFSAIWYALDKYNVTDLKDRKYYSRKGEVA